MRCLLVAPQYVLVVCLGLVPWPRLWAAEEVVLTFSVREEQDAPRYVLTFRAVEDLPSRFPSEAEPAIAAFFDQEAVAEVNRLREYCDLTDRQSAKLRLAARGDCQRLFRQAAQWRDKYYARATSPRVLRDAAQELAQLNQQLLESIYLEGSLFRKVLQNVLSERQRTELVHRQYADLVTQDVELRADALQCARLADALTDTHLKQSDAPLLWKESYGLQRLRALPPHLLEEILSPDQLAHVKPPSR